MQLQRLVCWVALAACLAACSQEVEYTSEQRTCIAQHYTNYDASKLSQCVDICRACMKGSAVTCNTCVLAQGREFNGIRATAPARSDAAPRASILIAEQAALLM